MAADQVLNRGFGYPSDSGNASGLEFGISDADVGIQAAGGCGYGICRDFNGKGYAVLGAICDYPARKDLPDTF